jgi:hypothetical protein
MTSLPMTPSCALDETGLRSQLDRYGRVGKGASVVSRSNRRLVVELAPSVDANLVEATVALERQCCPFFTLDWQVLTRRLTISVAAAEHEPALDGIAVALGVEEYLRACRSALGGLDTPTGLSFPRR